MLGIYFLEETMKVIALAIVLIGLTQNVMAAAKPLGLGSTYGGWGSGSGSYGGWDFSSSTYGSAYSSGSAPLKPTVPVDNLGIDIGLIKSAYDMTGDKFVVGKTATDPGIPVRRSVQTVNMLAHELSLYDDETTATRAAQALVGMIATGAGAGGVIRPKYTGDQTYLANPVERQLMIEALTKAADYLRQRGILDPFLESMMSRMTLQWNDDVTKSHGAVVMALLATVSQQSEAFPEPEKAYVSELCGDTIPWQDDRNWVDARNYKDAAPRHTYHAIEIAQLEEQRRVELERDAGYATRIGGLPVTPVTATGNLVPLQGITEELEQTVVPEKAALLAEKIMEFFKNTSTDLTSILTPGAFKNTVVRALAAVEKFRMLEISAAGLDKRNPKVADYLTDQNPETQAILVALVSAIQNYLYNPASTLENLRKLARYSANLREHAQNLPAFLALDVPQLIDEDLQRASQGQIAINVYQRILIDQENLKQNLFLFWMPYFDKETGNMTQHPTFVRYYASGGAANQCGFFSLGFESRSEAKQQIVDNLTDDVDVDDVYALADQISNASARIKTLMEKYTLYLAPGARDLIIKEKIAKKTDEMTREFLQDQQARERQKIAKKLRAIKEAFMAEKEAELQKEAFFLDAVKLKKHIDDQTKTLTELKKKIPTTKKGLTLGSSKSAAVLSDDEIQRITDEIRALEEAVNELKRHFTVLENQITRARLEYSRQAEAFAKSYQPAITSEVHERIQAETEVKLPQIPGKAHDFVMMLEEKDEQDTRRLLDYVKATKGFEHDHQVLAYFNEIIRRINAELEDINRQVDIEKQAAGFPQETPDQLEFALWFKENGVDYTRIPEQEFKGLAIAVFGERDALKARLDDIKKGLTDRKIDLRAGESRTYKQKQWIIENYLKRDLFTFAERVNKSVADQIGIFAAEKRILAAARINARLTKEFYAIRDFRQIVWDSMHEKFAQKDSGKIGDIAKSESSEELEFNSNKDWLTRAQDYTYLLALLNNYNIGAWISKSHQNYDPERAIYLSSNDGQYSLTDYVAVAPDAKRVDVINCHGRHFEKLVDAFDYTRAARSIRHKNAHVGLGNTRSGW